MKYISYCIHDSVVQLSNQILLSNWIAFLPSTDSCKAHVSDKEKHSLNIKENVFFSPNFSKQSIE